MLRFRRAYGLLFLRFAHFSAIPCLELQETPCRHLIGNTSSKVKEHTDGKTIRKIIFISGKISNIVAG